MSYQTNWVKQPIKATGLDHLGTQAPCINMYGQLLPGITNVTDRARYYSFYPWFIWAYEKEYRSFEWEELISRFRRADCLFTLIAAWHSIQTDHNDNRHGIAMIGRDTLLKTIQILEKRDPLYLSKYAITQEGDSNRYFKNKLGGLGQYYIGTFNELGLLEGNSRIGIKYTIERAQPIAEAFDYGIDRKLFFKTIEKDKVTVAILDNLKDFCPCRLSSNKKEHGKLLDLFFDRDNIYGNDGQQRRKTLLLYMHLINELEKYSTSEPTILDHHLFRSAVYTSCLPNKKKWKLPLLLKPTQNLWGIYQKNEMLSLSLQGIFWVTLRMIRESKTNYMSTEEFIDHFVKSDVLIKALGNKKNQSFSNAVQETKHKMVPVTEWENPEHEISLAQELVNLCSKQKNSRPYSKVIRTSLAIIKLLAAREDEKEKPYGNFEFHDDYFSQYLINLRSFRTNINQKWPRLKLTELIGWLANHWGVEIHIRIALRKLHRDKRNTFRIRPTDNGLIIVDEPEPVYTGPRFRQGIQILRDLGVIDEIDTSRVLTLTPLGKKILEENIGN